MSKLLSSLICIIWSVLHLIHEVNADSSLQQPPSSECPPSPLISDASLTCVAASINITKERWTLWTQLPYCENDTNYCVFTNANFPGPNRGVSIIDEQPTPGEDRSSSPALKTISSLLSFPLPSVIPKARQDSPPYEVRDIPGKGKGLIATRKIPRGKVFMVDYASLIIDIQLPNKVKRDQGRRLLKEAIERLPSADLILNLARSSPDLQNVPVWEDVVKTNSFSIEIGGRGYMALFPKIARINHACKPSALTNFNSTDLSNKVTAFHDILPGDEITISYTPFALPTLTRRALLLQTWGFTCICPLCTLPPSQLALSDTRRKKILSLGEEVVQILSKSTDKNMMRKAAKMYEEVVQAIKEEGLMPHMGEHYEILGGLLVGAGEVKRGNEMIRLAREERRKWEEGRGVGGE